MVMGRNSILRECVVKEEGEGGDRLKGKRRREGVREWVYYWF